MHGVALDDPPDGWRVANPEAAKAVMAAMLAGEGVDLVVESAIDDCNWLSPLTLTLSPQAGRGDPASRLSAAQKRH